MGIYQFGKITWKNFIKFFLVISVNYCFFHHFSTKVILVKLKILNILMQWSKCCFFFLNMFFYCKIVISFLELFPVTCFLCILQTSKQEKIHQFQQNVKNVNIWLLWWRHQMMIKVTFVNFLSRLIPYCQYSTKFHVKWTKIFWDTCVFTPPPPAFNFSGRYNNLWVACQIWFNKSQNFRVKLYYTKFSA